MQIELIKSSGKAFCRHKQCKRDPQYIIQSPDNYKGNYYPPIIKKGTTCVAITMSSSAGTNTSYYCRSCIDKIFEDVKTILNPKLWIIS